MKINLKCLFIAILVFVASNTFAQVGIGTKAPAASAALEITSDSNNKGILIPRITATQKDAISNPAEGLMIYQTSAPVGFYYYTGNSWRLMVTQTDINVKVDKVLGKELSTNDYTSAEKTKLAAVTGSNTGDQDLSSLATVASVALKANTTDVTTNLASKVDKITGKELSSNDYTSAEKTKLEAITGSNTGDQTTISGNAGTATKLAAPKNINGVAFDGSADITISASADAATLAGTTLNPAIVNSSLTSLGTLSNLTVSNPIVGSITGNAATVSTNASLTGVVTSTGNTTAIANGAISNAMLVNGAVANLTGTNSGDQTAATVVNVAAGNISAVTVQDALNELDTEKASLSSPTFTGTVTLPTGTIATTQNPADNSNKLATTAYVDAATVSGSGFVNLTGDQTIEGTKTFSATIISQSVQTSGDIRINGLTIGNGGGSQSTLIGDSANSSQPNNTALGFMTLDGNSGSDNTAVGTNSMRNSGATSYNTAIGENSGTNVNTGSNNTYLGFNANVTSNSTISNATSIGSGAVVTANNTIQLGADGTNGTTSIENVNTSGTYTGSGFKTPSGTSSQFLKADGTVDVNSYLVLNSQNPLAIGYVAGTGGQANNAIAIGNNVAQGPQATGAIGIGIAAAQYNQGENAVAIGSFAGNSNQVANSIAINASGIALNPVNAGFYVNPIRSATGSSSLFYDATTKEITYGSSSSGIPYTGANAAVDLGAFDLKVNGLTVGRGLGNRTNNTAVGNATLSLNTSGFSNTANGFEALKLNTSGNYNTAIGTSSLSSNTEGGQNTAVGIESMHSNTTGYGNSAIGRQSLASNTEGNFNTGLGVDALSRNTTGSYGVGIGLGALSTNTTGLFNTAVGPNANVATNNLTNATAIGNSAIVAASNTIQLGNTAITNVKTSGTITAGAVTYPNTHNASAGQVLTTNASGVASWATPASAAVVRTIGEYYGGGIVFYVTTDGLHGLIAETVDQSRSGTWYDAQNNISIRNNHSTAGKLFIDWRMPTRNELDILFDQRDLVGGFLVANYWNSTEYSSSTAYFRSFSDGAETYNSKTALYNVRAIRSF